MAIDPTTPVTPIIPSVPAGTAPDSVAVLQALARQALANTTAQLGEIVGRPTTATPKTDKPVEQASQTSTQDAGHASDAPSGKAALAATQALVAKPAPETRTARAVRTAAAEAVPRQTGLAPLMANVRAVVERPDAPVEVREAGKLLLARTPQAAEITTAQGLRRAVERSGVFLEAKMARTVVTPLPEGAQRTVEVSDLKAALLVFRGALSAWLARAAPLTVDDKAPAATPIEASETSEEAPQTPAGSASAPRAVPGPGQPAPAPSPASANSPTAEPIPEDVEVERHAAAPPPSADNVAAAPEQDAPSTVKMPTPPPAPRRDEAIEPRFASFLAPAKTPVSPAQAERAALPAVVQLGLIEEETLPIPETLAPPDAKPLVARGYGAAQAEARPKIPPPPYAGGPMAGQKPVAPELPADLSTEDLVRRLLKGTNGALARQDLMQIASLPEPQHHETETLEANKHQGARLNLDLPFMTPQGVAVAQLEIGHDGGGSGGGAVGPAERTYRARFSIDVEPLGPVHALVTLTGARARVSLWAERAETIARLRAGEESLGAALRQAELTPEVAVHSGAPSTAGVSALGHFVDQAS